MRRSTEYSTILTGPGLGSVQPTRSHAAQVSGNGSGAWPGVLPARAGQPQACGGCQVPSAIAD
eukprot:7650315-Alexandrium_andersonii.AAC.1